MTRKTRRHLLLFATVVALLAVGRSDFLLFEAPGLLADQAGRALGRRLQKVHHLRLFVTFDEAHPREWIHQQPTHFPGTEVVRGRIGHARRFNGSQYTYLATAVPWSDLGASYSLALWAKLEETEHSQTIWYAHYQGRETGFQLQGGQMRFHIPDGEGGGQTMAYPFRAYGRFVHLAAVVDGPGREARLYENGILKATCTPEKISLPHHNMEFGKWRWYAVTEPLKGSLDEAAAWDRALSPRAIRKAAQARLSLPVKKTPILYGLWRLLNAHRNAPAIVLKMLDRFNPFLHEGKLTANGLPAINLLFSPRDSRHFIHGHDLSLAAGRRIKDAARSRRIIAQYAEQTVDAELCLAGSDTHYAPTKRAGYILQLPADVPFQGSTRIRLIPPEALADNLIHLAASHSAPAVGIADFPLCRLDINGIPKGIYFYEPLAMSWQQSNPTAELLLKRLNPGNWKTLFRRSVSPQPIPVWPDTAETLEARLWKLQTLLSHDLFHPWSRREWSWRIQLATKRLPTRPPLPTSNALLGDNPAADYILSDLEVTALVAQGWSLRSSRPDIIATDGRVTRPDTTAPVPVTLDLHQPEASDQPFVQFNFRVMPRHRHWPALFIHYRAPPDYNRRVEFEAAYYAANQDDAPHQLVGGQATNGGLKYRGNTSYWRGWKKPFSLRFNEPVHLVGQRTSRYLYLLNGYVDATKLHNKLVFDLFREWGTPENPRYAPEIEWAEVFLNSHYLGIYETCTRVDGNMLDYASEPLDPEAVLYKMRPDRLLFFQPQTAAFDQVFPRPKQEARAQPLQELVAFTSQADSTEFARGIADRLDIANAIDFLLMLNFSGNMDGRITNFYLARGGQPGDRFFFIPWDYDHTFGDRQPWLSNHLFDRLREEMPDFMAQLSARWQELRADLMSDAALDQRIQTLAAQIADLMPWEALTMNNPETPSFEENVEQLRQAVHRNADLLDQRLLPAQPKE